MLFDQQLYEFQSPLLLIVTEHLYFSVAIAVAVPVIVADVLVLVLTWVCSYGPITQLRGTGERAPLHSCFCRDGT